MRNEYQECWRGGRGRLIIASLMSCAACFAAQIVSAQTPPDDFPHFTVPGHEPEMEALRNMFWKHYDGAGPGATLWDEWIPSPTLWPAVSTEARMIEIRERWDRALSTRILD